MPKQGSRQLVACSGSISVVLSRNGGRRRSSRSSSRRRHCRFSNIVVTRTSISTSSTNASSIFF